MISGVGLIGCGGEATPNTGDAVAPNSDSAVSALPESAPIPLLDAPAEAPEPVDGAVSPPDSSADRGILPAADSDAMAVGQQDGSIGVPPADSDALVAPDDVSDVYVPPPDGGSGFNPCPPRGTPCAIMPLGDSITYGFGSSTGGGYRVELFRQALASNQSITFVGSNTSGPAIVSGKPFPQANEGFSGYTIDTVGAHNGISPLVGQALANTKPNIVLLMIGTNDMHYGLDLPNAPTRLGRLIDKIATDAPNALVVVAKIIPTKYASQNVLTQTYNAAIPAVVGQRAMQGKHVVMVDMYSAFAARSWATNMMKDSEHPNDAGYVVMAQTWYPAISAVLR